MHCERQIWAECIDELDDVTTIRKSEVHQLCTCTEMHKELYAYTIQCARRYDGAAELLNHRKWTSFIHAVVVRVVNGFAQTLYEVKGLESCNYCYSLHTLGDITMRNFHFIRCLCKPIYNPHNHMHSMDERSPFPIV